jgi:hypothetical protein
MSAADAGKVFNLYQDGPTPDQVLQLCYLRRRAPRRLRLERTRIEDEFVLPRPELKLASLLPPPVDLSLEQLVGTASSPTEQASTRSNQAPVAKTTLAAVRESARTHFLQPRQASLQDVGQWSALDESDWLQLYRSLQRPKTQDDDMTGLVSAQVPDVADVCWLLEHCGSAAFASFVWDHLLIALLQQCVSSDTPALQCLFTLLVSRPPLASLSAKEFRAKLRARNLRQVDDAFGAHAELALVALYRRQRDGAQ